MKTVNKTMALVVLASLSFGAIAQDDSVLNSAPIDVDGYLHEKQVTDGELEQIKSELGKQKNATVLNKEKSKEYDKLAGQTEKLLESQDSYIDSKIDSQQTIKEFNKKTAENEKKLKCLLEESTSPDCAKWVKNRKTEEVVEDKVVVAQAAPVAQVVAPTPVVSAEKDLEIPFEEIKLLPFVGVTNYSGDAEKLETEFAGGVNLESNINRRFSMGIGLNYAQFNTQDFGTGSAYNQPYYGQQYYGFYGAQGREITFSNIGFNAYGKLFITRGERFRPYIGAGLGYSRMSLEYKDQSQFQNFGQNFGKEELTTGYMTGAFKLGSDVMITRSIGLNLEFQYSKGFGANNTDNGVSPGNAPDQRRLQQLSDDIISSNALSITGGAVIIF